MECAVINHLGSRVAITLVPNTLSWLFMFVYFCCPFEMSLSTSAHSSAYTQTRKQHTESQTHTHRNTHVIYVFVVFDKFLSEICLQLSTECGIYLLIGAHTHTLKQVYVYAGVRQQFKTLFMKYFEKKQEVKTCEFCERLKTRKTKCHMSSAIAKLSACVCVCALLSFVCFCCLLCLPTCSAGHVAGALWLFSCCYFCLHCFFFFFLVCSSSRLIDQPKLGKNAKC